MIDFYLFLLTTHHPTPNTLPPPSILNLSIDCAYISAIFHSHEVRARAQEVNADWSIKFGVRVLLVRDSVESRLAR